MGVVDPLQDLRADRIRYKQTVGLLPGSGWECWASLMADSISQEMATTTASREDGVWVGGVRGGSETSWRGHQA